jgi:sterol desaturase/sphingolipid hydroxylase (fatty acid hydroxylase superfamily)
MRHERELQQMKIFDQPDWGRIGNGVLLAFLVTLTMGTLLLTLHSVAINLDSNSDPLMPLRQLYWLIYSAVIVPLGNPLLFIGLPLLLLLEALRPAIRQDRIISKGLINDLGWMLIHGVMVITFILAFLDFANDLLAPWTTPFRLGLLSHVPAGLEIVVGYLLIELLGWFSHFLRHKVKVLWVFHEVHHSQTEMNPFTLFRVHPVDYLMAEVIVLLPSVFFEETLGIALAYLTISRLHDALTHSNIRTNLGWLRFVFVTPQSHRVHHSVEPAYHDMNFGVTLCIWDRIFGTHSPSDFVYPRTGIPDKHFPIETEKIIVKLPLTLLVQLGYPFLKAIQMFWSPCIRPNRCD